MCLMLATIIIFYNKYKYTDTYRKIDEVTIWEPFLHFTIKN